jgi:hypothetical protein
MLVHCYASLRTAASGRGGMGGGRRGGVEEGRRRNSVPCIKGSSHGVRIKLVHTNASVLHHCCEPSTHAAAVTAGSRAHAKQSRRLSRNRLRRFDTEVVVAASPTDHAAASRRPPPPPATPTQPSATKPHQLSRITGAVQTTRCNSHWPVFFDALPQCRSRRLSPRWVSCGVA